MKKLLVLISFLLGSFSAQAAPPTPWAYNNGPVTVTVTPTTPFPVTIGSGGISANVFLGSSASVTNPSRNGDVTTGLYSPAASTIAMAISGTQSLYVNSTQTALGYRSLLSGTASLYNVAIGAFALTSTVSGVNSVAVGPFALGNSIGAGGDTALGYGALDNELAGLENTAIGEQACGSVTTGRDNTCIGIGAGNATLTTGSNNILIGTPSTFASGNFVTTPAASTSNFLNIGNLIFGTGMTGTVMAPLGSVGIGSSSPRAALDLSQNTGAIIMPIGTTGTEPVTAINGMIRYNQDYPDVEAYIGNYWTTLTTGGGSASIYLGTSATTADPARNGDATTGLFSAATSTVSIATGGNQIVTIGATGVAIGTGYAATAAPANGMIVQGSIGVGLTNPAVPFVAVGQSTGSFSQAASFQTQYTGQAILGPLNLVKESIVQIVGGESLNNPALLGIIQPNEATSGASPGINFAASNATSAQLNSGTYSALFNGQNLGTIYFGGDNGVYARVNSASIISQTGGNWSSASTPANIQFATVGVGTTASSIDMIIAPGGGVSIGTGYVANTPPISGMIVQGSVGIGTNSPTTILDVAAAGVGPQMTLRSTASSGFTQALFTIKGNSTNGSTFVGQSGFTGAIHNGAINGDYVVSNRSGAGILLSSDNSFTRVDEYINSSGNIGFGTSTITHNLGLTGQSAQTIGLEREMTAATAGNNLTINAGGAVAVGTNLAGGNLILQSGKSTGTGTSQIQFQTYAAGSSGTGDNTPLTAMTISGSGNVGIGSTSPRAVLDLSQNTGAIILPIGTTGQEPTGPNGMIRYNSTSNAVEAYQNNVWGTLASSSSAPTITVETSGSAATYTTPAGTGYLHIRMCGGGGGGSGTGVASGGSGGNGGNTTISTFTAGGGGGGANGSGSAAPSGGTATGGTINIPGSAGSLNGNLNFLATPGASSPFGGAGAATNTTGGAAAANSCSGGAAAQGPSGGTVGYSGSAGGYVEAFISSPAATYTYTVGAAGSAGTAGSSGFAGGAGAAGIIIIEAYPF